MWAATIEQTVERAASGAVRLGAPQARRSVIGVFVILIVMDDASAVHRGGEDAALRLHRYDDVY